MKKIRKIRILDLCFDPRASWTDRQTEGRIAAYHTFGGGKHNNAYLRRI